MTRDLLIFTFLLVSICCCAAESNASSSKSSWVCDLGRTKGEYHSGGWVDRGSAGTGCKTHNQVIGYIAVIIAVLFYSSNFIPVKKFDTGDGMFFQWVMCFGVWLTGLAINFARQEPPFFTPVIIGAICWTTGNLLVVPIIKLIGMTMALTVWGIFNMLSGWLQGILLLEQHAKCKPFNYSGVAAIVLGTIVFGFVTSEGKTKENSSEEGTDETNPLLKVKPKTFTEATSQRVTFAGMRNKATLKNKEAINGDKGKHKDDDYSWVDTLGFWPRKICGFGLSIVAGLLYSLCFTFMQLMELCTDSEHKSVKAIDYTFGLFTGILLASSFYFIAYAAYKRNKPVVYPKIILPGLISGIMWGIATTGWIVANSELSMTVSYPLVSSLSCVPECNYLPSDMRPTHPVIFVKQTFVVGGLEDSCNNLISLAPSLHEGPGALSSLYGIIWFREIKGKKNISIYLIGLALIIPGAVLIGLSKCNQCNRK